MMPSSPVYRVHLPCVGTLEVAEDGSTSVAGCAISRSEVYDLAQAFAYATYLIQANTARSLRREHRAVNSLRPNP
ncbi:hypothetical protein [Corynebacterium glaucum]|uniref:hypothetical protein n=1 Tax=Corynebacterium glaucum TaxID=187491 RepID=UPI00265815ED|nr:hypothetical protein [Corynebacterium glaucum]